MFALLKAGKSVGVGTLNKIHCIKVLQICKLMFKAWLCANTGGMQACHCGFAKKKKAPFSFSHNLRDSITQPQTVSHNLRQYHVLCQGVFK